MTTLDQLELIKCGNLAQKRIVLQIDVSTTVGDALNNMKRHGVTSLLIVNKEKDHELVGMLDIRMLVFFLAWGKYQSMQNGEGPRFSQDVDYAGAKVTDMLQTQSEGSRLWVFKSLDPIQNVVEVFSKGVHRAVVVGADEHYHAMLTQTDVVRWIARNHAFACILDRSLKELTLAGPNKGLLLKMTEADSVLEGFRKLGQNEVNAVAIVNSKSGRLMGNLSASDLKGIDMQTIRSVERPVMQFLVEHSPLSLNLVVVLPGDSLRLAVNKMLDVQVHRVWVVNSELQPLAVVSMTDVLSKFTAYAPEMQPVAAAEVQPNAHDCARMQCVE